MTTFTQSGYLCLSWLHDSRAPESCFPLFYFSFLQYCGMNTEPLP